jgi:hypothetical protein
MASFQIIALRLFRVDCFHGANIGACSAIRANFGINLVDITFGDSFYGTLIDTGSASGAIIIDFVSHDLFVFVRNRGRVSNAFFDAKIGIFLKTNFCELINHGDCFDF